MWLAFNHPGWRSAVADWHDVMPQMVAMFRAQMGEHLGDPVWEGFLERLLTHSSEFRDTGRATSCAASKTASNISSTRRSAGWRCGRITGGLRRATAID